MNTENTQSSPLSPVYRKAVEIFTLAKYISDYLVYDMSGFNENNEEHPDIYKTGDMVQKSVSLFPEIYNAENKPLTEEKEKHVYSVAKLTQSLYNTCNQLEKSVSHGHEFFSVLRREIIGFKKMQQSWMGSF